MLVGYACSTSQEGKLHEQVNALGFAGCEKIYIEEGGEGEKPEWQAAAAYLRNGDTIVVCRLDCIAGSLKRLVRSLADLEGKGIRFIALEDDIDTSSTVGRSTAKIFAALSAFDQGLPKKRRKRRAPAEEPVPVIATASIVQPSLPVRKKPGRRPALSDDIVRTLRGMLTAEGLTVPKLAQHLGVTAATIYRYLRANGASHPS